LNRKQRVAKNDHYIGGLFLLAVGFPVFWASEGEIREEAPRAEEFH
jgi:hypothetical protein